MMTRILSGVCGLSVLFGAIQMLCPEGGVKQVMKILCTVVLMLFLLENTFSADKSEYALEFARLHEREAALRRDSEDLRSRLDRLVIEEEYEAYIMDKADRTELYIEELQLDVEWSTEGLWVPYALRIRYSGSERDREALRLLVRDELGIPSERQEWIENERLEENPA